MKRRHVLVTALAVMATTAACTPTQVAQWVEWHNQDPAAAEAFANTPETQAQLQAQEPHVAWSVNWDKVARCESGGQWSHGLVSNRHGTFSGGLMIMQSAWRQYGGLAYASYAGGASKAAQIVVAERIVDAVGFDRAWQCSA